MKFSGDIIITDPMYILKDENDWELCEYGEALSELGIYTFFTTDGGDSVGSDIVDTKTGEKLGEFCSDSCMVSVMLLSEVLAYHPNCLDDLGAWCYTIINDFCGEVKRMELEDDEDQYWMLVGEGNICFRSDCAGD